MMKLLLPFALFFLTSVNGNLRGDLSHDDNRDLSAKKCKSSKFVSFLLFVAALFRWRLERQGKGSHIFTIFSTLPLGCRLRSSSSNAGSDATYTSSNSSNNDASYSSGTGTVTYACVPCSTHGN
jgi:hypothetical protein